MAFDAVNGEPHRCHRPTSAPRVFVEAMRDWSQPVICDGCGKMVYEVATRGGIEQFESLDGGWHDCDRPNGVLRGIWNVPVVSLSEGCRKYNLPRPHRFTVIVCVKRMLGDDPLYLLALKGVAGEKLCAFFLGNGELVLGDLTVLCGGGETRTLLTISHDRFDWDGEGRPEHLALHPRWLETAN